MEHFQTAKKQCGPKGTAGRKDAPERGNGPSKEPAAASSTVERPHGRAPPKGDDWFSRLFGFGESRNYEDTKRWLRLVDGDGSKPMYLESLVTGERLGCGRFDAPSLAELRRMGSKVHLPGSLRVANELGDVGEKHSLLDNRHAVFQAASQFNCLEFVGPSVRPEDGVAGYVNDHTQGPCCAITCGPGTVFRNYFVPLDSRGLVASVNSAPTQKGQTAAQQLLCLADLEELLGNGGPHGNFFQVQGGYTLAGSRQLARLGDAFSRLNSMDEARSHIRVGVHRDVQVTSGRWGRDQLRDPEHTVTQVYASACSVAYNYNSSCADWESLAKLVLEAAYEATLWAALLNAQRHGTPGSRRVFLTALGGGCFGNKMEWIAAAMERALSRFWDKGLDVRIVTYSGSIDPHLQRLASKFEGTRATGSTDMAHSLANMPGCCTRTTLSRTVLLAWMRFFSKLHVVS